MTTDSPSAAANSSPDAEATARAHRHTHSRGHGHAHDHAHDHGHTTASGTVLASALVLTGVFMVVEFVGGLLSGSLALIADAGHMLTDTAALALAWAAAQISLRPADTRRSFGYQRLRVLATFINGCTLLFIVAWIAIEAVQRLWSPQPVEAAWMLWLGGVGLAVNLIVFALLRRGDSHDMNIAAATLHVVGDLLGSVAAITAAILILFTGWLRVDPLLSLVVCALLVRSAWSLVKRSAHILMEGSPDWLDLDELRSTLEARIPTLHDVHHVHCWLVGPQDALLTMHASVGPSADYSATLRDIKALLAEHYGITHATIQLERECVDQDCG